MWFEALHRQRVDGSTIAAFRVLTGLLIASEMYSNWRRSEWYAFFNYQDINFPHEIFQGLVRLPYEHMIKVLYAIGIGGATYAIGVFTRPAIAVAFLGYLYQFVLEKSRYTAHFYLFNLMQFFLLLVDSNAWATLFKQSPRAPLQDPYSGSESGSDWSSSDEEEETSSDKVTTKGSKQTPMPSGLRKRPVPRGKGKNNAPSPPQKSSKGTNDAKNSDVSESEGSDIEFLESEPPVDTDPTLVPAWHLYVMRTQVCMVYFWAGIAKMSYDWLVLGQPVYVGLRERSANLGPFEFLAYDIRFALFLSWGGMFWDTLAPLLLCHPKLRYIGLAISCGFHITNSITFPDIGTFPYQMLATNFLFLPSDLPRRLAVAVGLSTWPRNRPLPRHPWYSEGPAIYAAGPVSKRTRAFGIRMSTGVVLTGLVVFGTVAWVWLPLRHHYYTDDVMWDSEATFFGWRMMMTQKSSWVRFRAVDPSTGRSIVSLPPVQGMGLSGMTAPRVLPRTAAMIGQSMHMMTVYAKAWAERIEEATAGGVWPGEGSKAPWKNVKVFVDAWSSLHERPFQRWVKDNVDLVQVTWNPLTESLAHLAIPRVKSLIEDPEARGRQEFNRMIMEERGAEVEFYVDVGPVTSLAQGWPSSEYSQVVMYIMEGSVALRPRPEGWPATLELNKPYQVALDEPHELVTIEGPSLIMFAFVERQLPARVAAEQAALVTGPVHATVSGENVLQAEKELEDNIPM